MHKDRRNINWEDFDGSDVLILFEDVTKHCEYYLKRYSYTDGYFDAITPTGRETQVFTDNILGIVKLSIHQTYKIASLFNLPVAVEGRPKHVNGYGKMKVYKFKCYDKWNIAKDNADNLVYSFKTNSNGQLSLFYGEKIVDLYIDDMTFGGTNLPVTEDSLKLLSQFASDVNVQILGRPHQSNGRKGRNKTYNCRIIRYNNKTKRIQVEYSFSKKNWGYFNLSDIQSLVYSH